MLPLDIPAGTTVESFVREVVPALHARLVPEGVHDDALTVSVRIRDAGSFTVRIRGAQMTVTDGETERPTLWVFTTARAVAHFLKDAAGPRRFLPRSAPAKGAVVMTDPRIVRRAAMANGRIELAIRDIDGERLSMVLGFGKAAKKPIAPEDADAVIEAGVVTVARVLAGTLPPEEALAEGDVTVRGSLLLAMQLALAVAPFYPAAP